MERSLTTTRVCAGAAALLLACACLGSAGCQNASTAADPETEAMVESALSSAGVNVEEVAAVVSGRIVTQQQVDDAIADERARYGLEDDDAWAAYLASSDFSEWDVRASTIKGIVDSTLVDIEAERLGIDVSDKVDQRVGALADLYPTHEAFVDAVEAKSYTEEGYDEAVRRNLLWAALRDAVIPTPDPTEEQVRQYAVAVAPTLEGRRSSHILLSINDYATAYDVYEQLKDGADFAELARAYSIDSSAAAGGDVGWDCLNSFAPAYQSALDQLEPGEMSGIVRTNFGYHIILCTDKYEATTDENGDIDIDAIPQELMDAIVQSMCESLTTQLFDLYISNLEATTPIAVFNEHGEQVAPQDIGLATEVSSSVDDVDEAVAEVQSTVQNAVEQGTEIIKTSSETLADGLAGEADAAGETPPSVPAGPVEDPVDPVEASAADPTGSPVGGANGSNS